MHKHYKRTLQPDCADHRDHLFCEIHGEEAEKYTNKHSKTNVDLRADISSGIIQQGLLNSCSACAISIAVEVYFKNTGEAFVNINANNDTNQSTNKETVTSLDASQMFIYYNERVLEDKVDLNAPVFIRDGIKSLFKNGICSEQSWPYPESALPESINEVIKNGTSEEVQQTVAQVLKEHEPEIHAAISEKPSQAAIVQAAKHRISRYCKLSIEHGIDEIKHALTQGMPVVFGMIEPKSFFLIPASGIMSMPSPQEERIGGHAMIAVGYDDDTQHFIVRNSYGEEFGDKGYCYMPYDFITGGYKQGDEEAANAFSFWCLTTG